jgi:hypothetical protein
MKIIMGSTVNSGDTILNYLVINVKSSPFKKKFRKITKKSIGRVEAGFQKEELSIVSPELAELMAQEV